jgi:hypothetical protein
MYIIVIIEFHFFSPYANLRFYSTVGQFAKLPIPSNILLVINGVGRIRKERRKMEREPRTIEI